MRGIVNTLLIGAIGGALSRSFLRDRGVSCSSLAEPLGFVPRLSGHAAAGAARTHRRPGISLGISSSSNRSRRCATLFSLWIAYTVVWLAYGLRLISASLLQVKPELEEAARLPAPGQRLVYRAMSTLPLIRFRAHRQLAFDLHDVRARVFHRCLSARARHRSDRFLDRFPVGHRRRGSDLGAFRDRSRLVGFILFIALRLGSETRMPDLIAEKIEKQLGTGADMLRGVSFSSRSARNPRSPSAPREAARPRCCARWPD